MTCLFLILHFSAIVFLWPALFVTVPLHIIAAILARKR